jgi:hypothetical protein
MALHDGEFIVREFAGLVQNVQRHHRLAQVVQQAGEARFAAGGFIQPQLLAQGHHQGADRHRMHVGVVVLRLQPGQAHQGSRVAEDRIGDVVDQWQTLLGVQGLAQPGLAEHRDDLLARLAVDGLGLGQFLGHRAGGLGRRAGRLGRGDRRGRRHHDHRRRLWRG